MERELFKQNLINSYGNVFEKKSQEILSEFYGNKFIIIKPYGNIGDRKNDGYIPVEGVFFQIFGPKERTESSEKQALSKFKEDFNQLEKHCENKKWPAIEKFYYVYNDKNDGVSPLLEEFRLGIEREKNIKCEIIGIRRLMDLYDKLSEEKQKRLRGELDKTQNGDYKVFKDLKEKFYESGLIDKLEDFYFGRRHHMNYFDLKDGISSGDYIDNMINRDPYYVFKNKDYEELRGDFCTNYSRCIDLLAMNYFESEDPRKRGMLETTYRHIQNVEEEFEKCKLRAVWALKTLIRKYYIHENI